MAATGRGTEVYTAIDRIEGIGAAARRKLVAAGIRTTNGFLKHCHDRTGRRRLARATGLRGKQILAWANMADLMRIRGVGPEFAELLEAAGVDTVKELRHRRARRLAKEMRAVNAKRHLTRRVPRQASLEKWIAHAKTLAPRITH